MTILFFAIFPIRVLVKKKKSRKGVKPSQLLKLARFGHYQIERKRSPLKSKMGSIEFDLIDLNQIPLWARFDCGQTKPKRSQLEPKTSPVGSSRGVNSSSKWARFGLV